MTPADLIRAFETLADAPDGVARLRELVLQLAVRGKLVPQDPSDEPASELLKRIAAEKPTLLKGAAERSKAVAPVSREEAPFEVPDGWKWARLIAVCNLFQDCPHKTPAYVADGPYLAIRPRDVVGGRLDPGRAKRVGKAAFDAQNAKHVPVAGDVAYSRELSLGWAAILPHGLPVCLSQGMVVMRPHSLVETAYFAMLLNGPLVRGQAMAKAVGAAHLHLNIKDIKAFCLPIPPLAEQRRILARVDELMDLLDRLESARTSRDATRVAMRDGALAALRDAEDAEAVEIAWARVAERMEDLFTDPADVAPLRQTILQLAVRGRLVPQHPSDEPASELLKRIAAEKARLVKAGKLRKQDIPASMSAGEVPFDVPVGWVWAHLQALATRVTDGDHQPPPQAERGIPFLVIGDLSSGSINLGSTRLVPAEYYAGLDWTRQPTAGDVLYTVTGSFGITRVVGRVGPFCVQRHVAIIKQAKDMNSEYLRLALAAPAALKYAGQHATGTAQKTVPLTALRALPIAVPPEAEQRRIVTRVDELLGLCDGLESKLTAAQGLRTAFSSAAVHHLDA